jgi:hypothetical protein
VLRELYGHMFANGGGIGLEHCTLTDDGVRCAIEYNCVRWGASEIPAQAGVAVYERGSSGLLAAARIYDDVEPPGVLEIAPYVLRVVRSEQVTAEPPPIRQVVL